METIRLSMRQRKQQIQRRRQQDVIDSFRPLTFQADRPDFDVSIVHVFPERDGIVLSLRTGCGTINVVLPPKLAHELGDGLVWLAQREQVS